MDFNRVYDRLVGFVLLTGVRRSEAGALEWSWIDDNAEIINIPAPITKSGRDHVVILTKVLRELLDQCPPHTGPLVFPSVRTVRKIEGWSKLQPELCVRAGIEFVLHDLRRSLLTHARELGCLHTSFSKAAGFRRIVISRPVGGRLCTNLPTLNLPFPSYRVAGNPRWRPSASPAPLLP